jgi:hypothetical protein
MRNSSVLPTFAGAMGRRLTACSSPPLAAWSSPRIVAGVGLLGDVAAVLAINVRAATTADPALAAASYDLLAMFTTLFGIPLSLLCLVTGVLLGRGTKWGVFRHGWVVSKLALLAGVILVGALVLGPGTEAMRTGEAGAEARLIAGAAYDVVALTLATGLSVFKPRRRGRSGRRVAARAPTVTHIRYDAG